jgi:glucosamine--fructose-6-phosphate aminotransferase (isomerizing)
MVSNYRELRAAPAGSSHQFRSETDTEVVAHLLEDCLAEIPESPDQLVVAVMSVFRRLDGLNAIAVLDVVTGQLAAAKNGSPLVLGWSAAGNFLASDFSALLEHTRRVTYVEDRQAVVISGDAIRVFDVDTGEEITPAIAHVEWDAAATELSGYPDFMTKEIHEQPAVLGRIATGWARHVQRLAAMIESALPVADLGPATAIVNAVPAQMLGYYLALLRGHDPDKPRNLAKSVTVK